MYLVLDYVLPALLLGGPVFLLFLLKQKDKHLFLNFILLGSVLMLALTMSYAGWKHFSLTQALEALEPTDYAARAALLKKMGSVHWASKGFFSFVALGIPYLFTVYITRFALHCLVHPPSVKEPQSES